MSNKNLEYYEQYKKFLEAAFEDLGYKVSLDYDENIMIVDRKKHARIINKMSIYFLMGATVATVGKWLDETWRDEDDESM